MQRFIRSAALAVAAIICLGLAGYFDVGIVLGDNKNAQPKNLPGQDAGAWSFLLLASLSASAFCHATAALLPRGRRQHSLMLFVITLMAVLLLSAAANLTVLYGTSPGLREEPFFVGAAVCLVIAVACARLGLSRLRGNVFS